MRQNLTHRISEQSALNPKLTFVIISKKVLATWPEEAKIKNTATPTRKIYNKFKGVYLRGPPDLATLYVARLILLSLNPYSVSFIIMVYFILKSYF